jgi:hypothetical protein
MRVRLFTAIAVLCAASSYGQGTLRFVYTFGGDDSPLHLFATFQASQQAVQTGFLNLNPQSPGKILTDQPHYVLYQGAQCPIFGITFPVDPTSGAPILVSGGTDIAAAAPNNDEIDIGAGIGGLPSDISIWRDGEPIAHYINSLGQWGVSYIVPEPAPLALLLCGFGAIAYRRFRDGCQKR